MSSNILGFAVSSLIVASVAPCARGAVASDDPSFWIRPVPGDVAFATERAIVFKDGYTLIVKSASAVLDEFGRAAATEIPASAVLGGFWATSNEGFPAIKSMTAEFVETVTSTTREAPASQMVDILRANLGKKVMIRVPSGLAAEPWTDLPVTVEKLLDPPAVADPLNDQVPWSPWADVTDQPGVSRSFRDTSPAGAAFVLLSGTDGTHMIRPIGEIQSISDAEAPSTTVSITREVRTRSKQLVFDFGPEAKEKPVGFQLFYFTPGIRWIPTYRISLPPESAQSAASMSLQGEILNELEDLRNTRMDLIVGVPNFRFREVVSPLSLESALRNSLLTAAPQIMGQSQSLYFANFQQRAGEWSGDQQDESAWNGAPELGTADSGGIISGADDLSVYELGVCDLKKGARQAVNLWNGSAPVRHIYTLDMGIVRSNAESVQFYCKGGPTGAPATPVAPDAAGRVWHQVELRNEGAMPWTTGPALLLKGQVPLGQGMMSYTPPQSFALVPVTVAVDIAARLEEEEIERKPDAYSWSGWTFAAVRKRVMLKVTSRRAEASPFRATVAVGGRAEKASNEGRVVINDFRADDWSSQDQTYRLNNHSDISWDLTLAPGEVRELTFECLFYVR